MRERDLQRATELFAQIKSLEGDFGTHDAFGKHLTITFQFPNDGRDTEHPEAAFVAQALDLNHDELHMRTNLLIRAMLDEKMTNIKAELRKLGVKIEDEVPPAPKAKASKTKLLTHQKGEKNGNQI